LKPVHRIAAVILVFCYLALGSGAVERWHNAQHAAEDAAAIRAAEDAGLPAPVIPIHDDSNCFVHAQIHLSTMAVAWVPLLILLGVFVAFLTLLPMKVAGVVPQFALACRGPPAR
jgi:hypothetical protein